MKRKTSLLTYLLAAALGWLLQTYFRFSDKTLFIATVSMIVFFGSVYCVVAARWRRRQHVEKMVFHDGNLYAIGRFTDFHGGTGIAKWDGAIWQLIN